jgi:hypothetical protein
MSDRSVMAFQYEGEARVNCFLANYNGVPFNHIIGLCETQH